MTLNTKETKDQHERKITNLLSDEKKSELEEILVYGEKVKKEGEKLKKKFRTKYINYTLMGDFKNLLKYMRKHKEEIEGKYKYLNKMGKVEREKFIEEYLHDMMLYSIKIEGYESSERKVYKYDARKMGDIIVQKGDKLDFFNENIGNEEVKVIADKIKLKEGIELNLVGNKIGNEGAKAIAENIKLKEWVKLVLSNNQIGDEGAKAIAENMKLKEGVSLRLRANQIGDEGAKAISHMELKEGVELDLYGNKIGEEGVNAISKIKLKEGVTLILGGNKIGDKGANAIAKNMKFKCGVELDLSSCNIGADGVKALSKMELKDGVYFNLADNGFGDDGAKTIIDNMKLVEGMKLDLSRNDISKEMKKKLKVWERSYHDRGIHCKVLV